MKHGKEPGESGAALSAAMVDAIRAWLDAREGLAAAAYVGGHSSTEMAGRVYVSPQADSAEAALRARAREDRFKPGTEPGTDQTWEAWAAILAQCAS